MSLTDAEYYSVLERTGAAPHYDLGTRDTYFRNIVDHFLGEESFSRLDMMGALEVMFYYPLLFCHIRFPQRFRPPIMILISSGKTRQFIMKSPDHARAAVLYVLHQFIRHYINRTPLPDSEFICLSLTIIDNYSVQKSIPSTDKFIREVSLSII